MLYYTAVVPISIESDAPSAKRRPKYVLLAEQFRDQVRAGTLTPGEQLPSFAKMQAEFGIGQATLERTYAILEEENLIVRHHGRGIFVAGRQPETTQHTLGIVAHSKYRDHPYYNHILKGAHRESERLGVEVMLLHDKSDLSWRKIDGALVLSGDALPRTLPKLLPLVEVMSSSGTNPVILADDYSGAKQATEYLLKLGHRRIAFLTQGRLTNANLERIADRISAQRVRAYADTLRAAGIELLPAWVRPVRELWEPMAPWADLGRKRVQQWLEEDWDQLGCTAILTQNDETAVGVVEAFQAAGRRVPDDVSVVGFDGYETADFFRPRLTTVQVPLEEIGARGAARLIAMIRGEQSPGQTVETLPTTLRIGESTAALLPSKPAKKRR